LSGLRSFSRFVVSASVSEESLSLARNAVLDTVGVTLAGSREPAARVVQAVALEEGGASRCRILGTPHRTSAGSAALANGTAAHALDFDDMCFVSLAHPSAPLVCAGLAAAEIAEAPGRLLLEAYVVGFEVEAVLGRVMNPAHYHRGWHCTSTLGSLGAAAAAARILRLDAEATLRALAIAASEASGLKENFGTMVKPLHAGLAARNGVLAALWARSGLSAAEGALDGRQGFLTAMASEKPRLEPELEKLGRHWEILQTGITVKLYPSCAATHPALDALFDLRRQHRFGPEEVEAVEIGVDATTPTVLIHDRPTSGLEAKFSMPFCAAAALTQGEVGLDTFELERVQDPGIQELLGRIRMRVEPDLGKDARALTQAQVRILLRDGRRLEKRANGARGYPANPASEAELEGKFRTCARRALPETALEQALTHLKNLDGLPDVRTLTELTKGG
jgi:2-methylcitrate dehydratase PrpD